MKLIGWMLFAAWLLVGLLAVSVAHAATVRSRTGHTAKVSAAFAPHIQCFINKLDAVGYRIDFMTGYAARSNPSAHPTGNAIDINQTGFGRVTRRLPHGFVQMAATCGVYSGSHFGDTGHFEMPNKYGYVNLHRYYAGGYREGNHRWTSHTYSDASFGASSSGGPAASWFH